VPEFLRVQVLGNYRMEHHRRDSRGRRREAIGQPGPGSSAVDLDRNPPRHLEGEAQMA